MMALLQSCLHACPQGLRPDGRWEAHACWPLSLTSSALVPQSGYNHGLLGSAGVAIVDTPPVLEL